VSIELTDITLQGWTPHNYVHACPLGNTGS